MTVLLSRCGDFLKFFSYLISIMNSASNDDYWFFCQLLCPLMLFDITK